MRTAADYFDAERLESLLFIASGLLAIAVAAWCRWRLATPLARGAAAALLAIALIQLTVGGTILWRSPHDLQRVLEMRARSPQRIPAEEIPRMQAVMRNFERYRAIEIALLAAGGALLLARRGSAWQGAGIGLAAQSGWMLMLDHFAEQRGAQYLVWLAGLPGP